MSGAPPPELASAREQFNALVDGMRPDLHRYAARLVGSAIDGEDVVQDTLAKAFYALSQSPELPELRPWLFRIAHNTAIDFLRRYERKHVDLVEEIEPVAKDDFPTDPEVLRAALSAFMALPVTQRSAVILKDVLDESLEDIAEHVGGTVGAVKSLLVRGRAKLRERAADSPEAKPTPTSAEHRALVREYVALFNQRDWPGVQALLLEECRLDLVAKSQRQGKSVSGYFARYANETNLSLRSGRCEGREALGAFRGDSLGPEYVILLESRAGRVSLIRDFRYVPYLSRELTFVADPDVDDFEAQT
ncbi:MAG: sigma-70 family RNA polymerase sigma factor [Myxococcales bacterium]|nr:sigma-70 family RNA polymerase sigma factor [Myxococcales bacterium]